MVHTPAYSTKPLIRILLNQPFEKPNAFVPKIKTFCSSLTSRPTRVPPKSAVPVWIIAPASLEKSNCQILSPFLILSWKSRPATRGTTPLWESHEMKKINCRCQTGWELICYVWENIRGGWVYNAPNFTDFSIQSVLESWKTKLR